MEMTDEMREEDWIALFNQVRDADMPDLEKLVWAFGWITDRIIFHAQQEVELARAMHDQEETVKQQIKMETIKTARNILDTCYRRLFGRRAWDAQDRT